MKNLLSKVLVVLTVSAVFAGNLDAMRGSTRYPAKMAKIEVSQLGFFELVQKLGTPEFPDDFGVWSKEERRQALIDQYGSIEKTPDLVKVYLIGSPENDTKAFRARYKQAVLNAIASGSIY